MGICTDMGVGMGAGSGTAHGCHQVPTWTSGAESAACSVAWMATSGVPIIITLAPGFMFRLQRVF